MLARIFNQKYKLFAPCLILLSGTLIYSNSCYCSFHLDDYPSIINNPAIRHILNLPAIWGFWPTRFITYLSLALNYRLSQLDVFSYHLFNLAVHLSCAILAWWLILLTFSTPAMRGQKITKHAQSIAFFTGLVFVTHPLQTQGVIYIIQRAVSLATLFYLAALSFYVKSRLLQQKNNAPATSRFFYYASLLAVIMAMFTKEMAITLPLMIISYEVCFLRTKEKFDWGYFAPFLATLLIIPLTMFLTKSVDFIGMKKTLEESPGIASWQYLGTQLRVIVTYLRLLFIPVNQNLDYDYPLAKSLLELPVLISFIFLASLLTIAVKIFSKYRLLSFGIFWFFLTLLPESSVIPIKDVIFEHRLYLPMAGFSVFLASLPYYLFGNKSAKPVVIALLIITSGYALLTYARNPVWKDELTLWNDAAQKSPKKARPYNNRGNAYKNQGNIQMAFSDFDKALAIDPDEADIYYNRGITYKEQGNIQQAISDFTRAIAINPRYTDAYYNRGTIYKDQGNIQQAFSDYTMAVEINPNDAQAHNNRGAIYGKQGNARQAFSDFNKALAIDPGYGEAYYNRGLVYFNQGSLSPAIADYTKTIEINPGFAEAYNNRGVAYFMAKKYDQAWLDVQKAEELGYAVNPGFIDTLKKVSGKDR